VLDLGLNFYQNKRIERGLPETVSEPLFAAFNRSRAKELSEILADSARYTVVQSAPAVRAALAEDFGHPFGTLSVGKLAAALRRLGFDKIYDSNFSADLTIMEEGTELAKRISGGGTLPMFTSCCPGWVRYLENNHPDLTRHLSTCKSPQQMAGALFKTYGATVSGVDPARIFSVSVMPCTAKAYEASRQEMSSSGFRDVDLVITTRELAWLIRQAGIDFDSLPDEDFDEPMGEYTGAGAIFAITGGVMESAIRTGHALITGKELNESSIEILPILDTEGFRSAKIKFGKLKLKVGVITGLKNVAPVLDQLRAGKLDLHFIEVMACPEGCVTGGGQPKLLGNLNTGQAYSGRAKTILQHSRALVKRKSHESAAIKKVYAEFLEEPNSHRAHELLHTSYGSALGHH
jgi:ferredoxin hydrogenase